MASIKVVGTDIVSGQIKPIAGGDVIRPDSGALTVSGGSSTLAGGLLTLTGGTPTSGAGGGVDITGQAGVAAAQNGGSVTVTAGAATTSAAGGSITLTTGVSPSGTAGSIIFNTGTTASTRRAQIDNGGTLIVGDGTAGAWLSGPFPTISYISYRNSANLNSLYGYSATAGDQPLLQFARGRGTAATPAATVSGDAIGEIRYTALYQATTGANAVVIAGVVDGTVSATSMPGRVVISTTPASTIVPVERMRINNNGCTYLGDGTLNLTTFAGSGTTNVIQAYRDTSTIIGAYSFSATATTSPAFLLLRSRGTAASPTVVSQDDVLGGINFQGIISAAAGAGNFAAIYGLVDGTVGTGDTPGRLSFQTTPDASGTLVERLRINNLGTSFFGDGTINANWGSSGFANTPQYAYRTASSSVIRNAAFTNTALEGPAYLCYRARGTTASPLAVSSGDLLGGMICQGATTAAVPAGGTQILSYADGNHSSGSGPGRITFDTCPSGSTTLVERMRINNLGTTFLGDGTLTTAAAWVGSGAASVPLVAYRAGASCEIEVETFSATATEGSILNFLRSRGTAASPTVVSQDDRIGQIGFSATTTSGTTNSQFCVIAADVDGDVGSLDSPGRLVFLTSPDGSSTPVERMRINNAGVVFVGNGATAAAPNAGIISGTGGSGAVAGAALTIRGGAGGSTLAGGALNLNGGTPTEGNGGAVAITGSAGATATAAARNGGAVTITAGLGVSGGTNADINFAARSSGNIPFNAAAPDNALVGFTATSIVGALNEVKAAVPASVSTQANTTTVSLAGGGTTDGQTLTLAAGALAATGDWVEIEGIANVTSAGGGAILLDFGGTNLVTYTVGTNGLYVLRGRVFRTGATTQKGYGTIGTPTATNGAISTATPAETLANAITIKTSRTGTLTVDFEFLSFTTHAVT